MNDQRDYVDYVSDVRDNLLAAWRFAQGLSFEEFLSDEKTQYAIVRAFEIVGEAAKHIPEEVRGRHPQVPWKEMAGMRDRLIHNYLRVSLHIVWEAATSDTQRYLPLIEAVLKSEEARGS